MKTTAMILSMITLFTVNVLGQSGDVETLLKNRDTREDVFNTIMNDHNLMMEFMDQMSGNTHAMTMMRGNQMMMNNLLEGNHMQNGHMGYGYGNMMGMASGDSVNEEILQEMGHLMDQCNTDSTICAQLTGEIAQHPDMMRMMMRMMHQEGLPESSPQPKGEQSEQQ